MVLSYTSIGVYPIENMSCPGKVSLRNRCCSSKCTYNLRRGCAVSGYLGRIAKITKADRYVFHSYTTQPNQRRMNGKGDRLGVFERTRPMALFCNARRPRRGHSDLGRWIRQARDDTLGLYAI